MKIIILTTKKQIYSPLIIKKILSKHTVSGVFASLLSGHKKSLFNNIKFVIKNSGWLYLFLRTMGVLHNSFLSLVNPKFRTIEKFCQKNNIPIYQSESINSDKNLEIIKKIKPDIIISLFFNQIIKQKIFSLSKHGCINVHRALLPKHRGPNSAFWQMANNEKISGTTIHYIDEGIDSGDIILQIKYPILKSDSHHSLCLKNVKAVNSVLMEILNKIENNQIKRIKQQNEQATVYPFPDRQAAKNFLKHQKRMF